MSWWDEFLTDFGTFHTTPNQPSGVFSEHFD